MRHARAIRLALAVSSLAACTDQIQQATDEPDWRGELVVTIVDSSARPQTLYWLRTATGERRRLLFAEDPGWSAGTAVRLWGAEVDGVLHVSRLEADPIGSLRQGLIRRCSQAAAAVGPSC
jgi:hypothetical protein